MASSRRLDKEDEEDEEGEEKQTEEGRGGRKKTCSESLRFSSPGGHYGIIEAVR